MFRSLPILLFVLCLPVAAAEGLLMLVDPLDEPEQYCVDVPGFGRRVNLDAPLMAHTCKPGANDELFTVGHPRDGQIYMRAYQLCAQAAGKSAGAEVHLRKCGASELQRFQFDADGRIRLSASNLCLAVAPGAGTKTGGPSHLRRDLALEQCASTDSSLSTWKLPGSR